MINEGMIKMKFGSKKNLRSGDLQVVRQRNAEIMLLMDTELVTVP